VVPLLGYQVEWCCILNAIPECSAIKKNAQLMPKPASTNKLTPVTACSRLKKCMHRTLTQKIFITIWMLLYRLDQLKTDFAPTELAATIEV